MNYRKYRRCLYRAALSLLLCLCAIVPFSAWSLRAEAVNEEMFGEVYFFYNASGGYVIDDVWAVMRSRWTLAGKTAYCVNPDVLVAYEDVYAPQDFMSYEGLPEKTRNRLADIARFGWNENHTSALDYAAAQLMIWTAVNPELSSTVVYCQDGDSMVLVDGEDVTAEVQEHINRIEADISRYHTSANLEIYNTASEEYLDPSGGVIETAIGDEIVINDRAGVLADYQITAAPQEADLSQDGNTVSLCFHEAAEMSQLRMRRRESDPDTYGYVLLYLADGSQNIVTAGAASNTEELSLKFNARGVDLRISKTSSNQLMALKDARLGLYEDANENGICDDGETLIEEFLSSEEEHVVHGLVPGRHYVLHEITAPNGHIRAEDIALVPERGDIASGMSCQMMDRAFQVIVRKNTQRNDRIADVELAILDAETMETAKRSDGQEAVYRTMADIDWDCSEYLQEGKGYILRETELVGGVFKSADTYFTAPKAGDPVLYVSVTMTDQTYQVHIRKVDNTENASVVPEVTLTLYEKDGEEEKELASHVTEADEAFWDVTQYVRAEHSYVLKESECAPGYYLSDEIEFTLPASEKLQEDDYVYDIVMVDDVHNCLFGKKDEEGNWLEGAVMLILDEEMEERMKEMSEEEKQQLVKGDDYLYRFVSEEKGIRNDEEGEEIRLYSGRTYYLHEEQAPFGYVPSAEDMPFTVTGTLEMCQDVAMTDERQDIHISVYKYDADDKKTALSDTEFTVYRKKDGMAAVDSSGNQAVQRTDEKGQCSFVLPYEKEGYEIRETAAPSGYLNSSKPAEVMISDEKAFDPKTPVAFRFYDRRIPETSAKSPAVTALIACLALTLFVCLQRHHG